MPERRKNFVQRRVIYYFVHILLIDSLKIPNQSVTTTSHERNSAFIRFGHILHSLKMTQNGIGGSDIVTLYSAVVAKGAPASSDTQPSSDRMKLKKALRDLMAQYPEGITLSKARRSCSLLLDSKVLNDYASVRQLLASMPDVVTLWGFGVQTFLLPAGTKL